MLTGLVVATLAALAQDPQQADSVYDCVGKCPDGVTAPVFTFFPQIDFSDASVRGRSSRMRTYLTFRGIVGVNGVLEPESVEQAGGTARRTEAELRRGLAQARFTPAQAGGAPVRARVTLRFDFEAEGTNWIRYTYKIVSR
jgi:hypothetical protein